MPLNNGSSRDKPKRSKCENCAVLLERTQLSFLASTKKGAFRRKWLQVAFTLCKDDEEQLFQGSVEERFSFLSGQCEFHSQNKSCRPGACTPDRRIWQKHREGTSHGCTNKGRKEETGGRVIHLFVALSWMESILSILSMRISMECSLEHRKEIRNCVFKMEIPVKIALQWKEYFNW